MNDVMVNTMGSMSKDDAPEILKKNGYTDKQIQKLEESLEMNEAEYNKFIKLYNGVWNKSTLPKLKKWNKQASGNLETELYDYIFDLFKQGKINNHEDMEMQVDRAIDNFPIK